VFFISYIKILNRRSRRIKGHKILKTNRISTTISQKHKAILNKHTEKHHTQQKVLEIALESLEKNSGQEHVMAPEEELWVRIGGKIKTIGLIQKGGLKFLISTANIDGFAEFVNKEKPMEYTIEYYHQKSLKECSLKEVIDALIISSKVSCMVDFIEYKEDKDHYMIKMNHNMGLNNSKMLKIMSESLFKSYGTKAEIQFSERSVFTKVYKN
jgi:hypothetical protein